MPRLLNALAVFGVEADRLVVVGDLPVQIVVCSRQGCSKYSWAESWTSVTGGAPCALVDLVDNRLLVGRTRDGLDLGGHQKLLDQLLYRELEPSLRQLQRIEPSHFSPNRPAGSLRSPKSKFGV